MLINGWFLLANGVCTGIIAGIICMGIEKKMEMFQYAYLLLLLSFTKL